jgi:hypothetical protein
MKIFALRTTPENIPVQSICWRISKWSPIYGSSCSSSFKFCLAPVHTLTWCSFWIWGANACSYFPSSFGTDKVKCVIRATKRSSPGWPPGRAPCCCADAARPLSGGIIGALHVGQVCWRSSHDLRQCTWNKCPQSSFFAVVISSRQIIHVASLLNIYKES